MLRIAPLFLLLAGCAADTGAIELTSPQGVGVRAFKLDQLQNSYELTPRTGWVDNTTVLGWLTAGLFTSDERLKEALRATAPAACAPGNVATLDVERPDYITVRMTSRGYLHCQ